MRGIASTADNFCFPCIMKDRDEFTAGLQLQGCLVIMTRLHSPWAQKGHS